MLTVTKGGTVDRPTTATGAGYVTHNRAPEWMVTDPEYGPRVRTFYETLNRLEEKRARASEND